MTAVAGKSIEQAIVPALRADINAQFVKKGVNNLLRGQSATVQVQRSSELGTD
ncbi:hypothetical protein T261_5590 [Streptomyces lydicus]|nr:hypothetical protein T261_5590 [Streptomyces lydicus]